MVSFFDIDELDTTTMNPTFIKYASLIMLSLASIYIISNIYNLNF